jgi:signal transduction histidine kinase
MMKAMSHASLRVYLLTLAASAVVPVICFAAYLTIGLSRTERAAVERGLSETTGALISSVDRELVSTITALEALATSEALDRSDHAGFAREVHRVLDSQALRGWLTVHLASPDGTPLMNSSAPRGGLPPLADIATVKEAAASATPVISDLLPGRVLNQPAFAVRVPVLRDGSARWVLSATISAPSMLRALRSQQNVADRIAVLYDRSGNIVFRTINAEMLIGTPVTPRLAMESADRASGVIDDVNREGTAVRTVFQRSGMSGWTVAVGVPHRVLYAAQRQRLLEVLAVGGTLLGLSATVALIVARHIGRSVSALVANAETLSAPDYAPVTARDTPITELARLGDALAAAARLIRERGVSRELQVEDLRIAREEAEKANRAKDNFLALLSHELRTPECCLRVGADVAERTSQWRGNAASTRRDHPKRRRASAAHR